MARKPFKTEKVSLKWIKSRQPLRPAQSFGLLLFLSLIWGSSFILIKKGLTVYSPLEVGALRITISALCFLPILITRIKRFHKDKLKYYLVVAFTGSGIPAFLFPLAQTHIESAVAGILNALTPLFTLFLGILFFGKQFKRQYLLGILVGLLGVIMLSVKDIQLNGTGGLIYYLLAIMATFCYGISVNTVDSYLKKVDSITLSASTFVFLGPFGISYLLTTDIWNKFWMIENGQSAFTSVFVLAFFGTFLSTMIFFYVVHQTSALYGSLVAYLIPVIALFWGFYFGEVIGLLELAGLFSILIGIYLARKY